MAIRQISSQSRPPFATVAPLLNTATGIQQAGLDRYYNNIWNWVDATLRRRSIAAQTHQTNSQWIPAAIAAGSNLAGSLLSGPINAAVSYPFLKDLWGTQPNPTFDPADFGQDSPFGGQTGPGPFAKEGILPGEGDLSGSAVIPELPKVSLTPSADLMGPFPGVQPMGMSAPTDPMMGQADMLAFVDRMMRATNAS